MLDSVSYGIWLTVILAEVFCLVSMIRARAFADHFTLLLYLCSCLANEIGAHTILQTSEHEP